MVNQRKFDPQAPLQEGEFQRIDGIGERTEKALHEAGIETFEELSALKPQEIAGKLKGVAVLKTIVQNDWPGQAAKFAQQLAESRLPAKKEDPEERQYYESFMVVLLLDDEHAVRRTKVSHVQKGMEANWAGWDEPRLVKWITAQAQLAGKQTTETSAKERGLPEEPGPGKLRKAAPPKLVGDLKISKLQFITPVLKQVQQAVSPGSPFGVRIKLDFREVEITRPANLMYHAEVGIRSIHGWKTAYQGQIDGQISPDDDWPYLVANVPELPEGCYHLAVAVQVYPAVSADASQGCLSAQAESKMLRVTWEAPKLGQPERREENVAY